ncbi:MAG: citrate lyase acyl carrier protein [Synergistaceae bacterium]|nr:citrate lyase acyl carrier protein [Synergistaceae bacterium]
MSKLILLHTASAGTLESSDCLVTVSPAEKLALEYKGANSTVFAERTMRLVESVTKGYALTGAEISIQDQGALEITIRARLETALERAGKVVTKQ